MGTHSSGIVGEPVAGTLFYQNAFLVVGLTAIWSFRSVCHRYAGTEFADKATHAKFLEYRAPIDAEKGNGYRWMCFPVAAAAAHEHQYPLALLAAACGLIMFTKSMPPAFFVFLSHGPIFLVHLLSIYLELGITAFHFIMWIVAAEVCSVDWVPYSCQIIVLFYLQPGQHPGSDHSWLNAVVLAWFIEHHRVCIRVHMKAFLLHRKAALAARATKIVGVGLILTDHTTKIVFVNNAWCNITGYTADEVVGKKHGSKPVDRSSQTAGTSDF